MSFKIRAEGGAHAADRDEIRRALSILIDPAQTFELRGIYKPRGARSKVCRGSDLEAAVESAWDLSDASGVYFTLNPCRDDLSGAASDKDIEGRRWMLVDCDAVRPADTSATSQEKDAAIDLACEISEYLSGLGWPSGTWIDSGNGGHILYPIDLPADKLAGQLVKGVLASLAKRFDNDRAKVDVSVSNAARISKLPGTFVRKGPDTPDRPHRMARLIRVQSDLSETVTADMLNAVAFPPKPDANGHANGHYKNSWSAKATADKGLDKYVRVAIERECNRVLMAIPGVAEGRNVSLNKATFNLATMASWPEMNAADAKIALYQSAIQAGLGEGETKATIESAWNAGSASDKQRIRPADQKAKAGKPDPPKGKLVVFGSQVIPKKVRWLWPDRIAVGFISIFAGQTGIGKSFVLCDFAARVSNGGLIPESIIHVPKGRVLMISEDPYDYVLAPRLREMGADMDMIGFLTWEAMASYTLGNIEMLEQAWKEAGEPTLIIIDPPANFLGSHDEHKNAEVRQVLMGLVAWLSTKEVACVFITHVNKQTGKGIDAVNRIMGSVAWASTARVAVGFAPDPNQPDRCLMAGIKNNLGPKAKTLAYEITKTDSLARVEWKGHVDTTADEAMNQTKKKSRGLCAVEWLEERFREKREWESNELKRLANEAGISKNALWSPEVNALPIMKRQRFNAAGDSTWFWISQDGWPPMETDDGKDGKAGKC